MRQSVRWAAAGSPFKLGRKKSLMIGAILFVAGSLFSAAAPNVEVLILSRVLLGLAVGVASYTAPLYLSEIAPEKKFAAV